MGFKKPKYIVYFIGAILIGATLSFIDSAIAQNKNQKKTEESYTRPKPTRPIKPTIPDANRFQSDKVFLEYADSLFRPADQYQEFQVVKGSVKFRQGGMWMFCDSAYYYPQQNSMDAFGHVHMEQGDTLFVYADHLYYDGSSRHASLGVGPSRNNVQLKNRNVTLTTDSLDYDLNSQRGWYTTGGVLEDDVNRLTSVYGEYVIHTKEAEFRDNVLLVNNKDGFKLISEELLYNTGTHIADITVPTRIEGATDTIITSLGKYNTVTDHAELLSRSTILHRDSSMNVTTLEGDSIIYDKATRISRAFMFRDPRKLPAPMVINDTARKVTLIGGYGEYNDELRRAISSDYPLLIEYSRPDSLFLRADTVMSMVVTHMVIPDSLKLDSISSDSTLLVPKDFHEARAIGKARFFNRDLQGIADTLLFKEQDSILYMIKKPIVWSDEQQVYGNKINVHFNDSVPDWAELPDAGMLAERVEENFYNQMSGSKMKAYLDNKKLKRLEVEGNVIAVFLPQENDSSYNKLVNVESSFMNIDMEDGKIKHLKMWPEVSGTVTPLFEVKSHQQFIDGFRWLDMLRPKRQWYGDRLHWLDELGDVPDELEEYFKQPQLLKSLPTASPNPFN